LRQAKREDRTRGRSPASADAAPGDSGDDSVAAPANVPLGILDATRYDALTLRLDVGDLVLCYTDGLSECRDRDASLPPSRLICSSASHRCIRIISLATTSPR
jgi:hypothetical protein